MALKTNYKNFIPDANGRVYSITQNAQGNSIIEDITTYIQVGDNFGANDMNAIGTEVNEVNRKLASKVTVNIPTSGWGSKDASTQLYHQNIAVSGVTSSYVGTQSWDIVRGASLSVIETAEENASYIKKIESYNGGITVFVDTIPSSAFQIILYGV